MKYKLIPEGSLYRIKAIESTKYATAGTLGGLVESAHNLNQEGACWISRGAKVLGAARVSGDAIIGQRAFVSGDVEVYGNVLVFGHARILDYAQVYGHSSIGGYATVRGRAVICGNAYIGGRAEIADRSCVYDRGEARAYAKLIDNSVATKPTITLELKGLHITLADNNLIVNSQCYPRDSLDPSIFGEYQELITSLLKL